ncbi:MAG TPA: hypothetical protein PLJ47_05520 [Candidatus Hydrogenedentes bacterium]|nr:hypothetical protein [Candidatus Hydrogenedentota bacterium]HRK34038.1 hypothetical protein [Candidatus Hydrogenedentota bacterium]
MTANKEPSSFRLPKDSTGLHFQNWLHVATRELSEDTKARIVSEVTDHFDAACADLRANGVEATSAYFKVLDSLGDPEAARATYAHQDARHDWTEDDLRYLFRRSSFVASLNEWMAWSLFSLFILFIAVVGLDHANDTTPAYSTWGLLLFAITFGLSGMLFRAARYSPSLLRAKMRLIAMALIYTASAIYWGLVGVKGANIVCIIFSLFWLAFAYDHWKLIRELPTIPIDNDAD